MRGKSLSFLIIFIILLLLSACQTKEEVAPEIAATSTNTPIPTNTPQPSPTPSPSPTPNAETVLENSAVAMDALQSVTQEQVSLLSASIISNTQTQSCDYEQPANAYCHITAVLVPPGSTRPLENKYEILFLDGEAWTRQDGRPQWDSVSGADAESLSLIAEPQTPFQLPQTGMLNVQMNGVSDLDGVAVYELEAIVDETAVSSILGPSVQGLLAFTQNMEVSTKLSVGVDDFLIYKQIILATFTFQGQPVEFTSEITNSGFNEPKKFPDPSATN
jgi:hypothetical protein